MHLRRTGDPAGTRGRASAAARTQAVLDVAARARWTAVPRTTPDTDQILLSALGTLALVLHSREYEVRRRFVRALDADAAHVAATAARTATLLRGVEGARGGTPVSVEVRGVLVAWGDGVPWGLEGRRHRNAWLVAGSYLPTFLRAYELPVGAYVPRQRIVERLAGHHQGSLPVG